MNDDMKMIQLTVAVDTMTKKAIQKHYSTTAVTARSIRNELDYNEKDRPTTTEVTPESVNWNSER